MDWDQDKGIFYFIDTADSVVRSYPVDENGVPKRSADGVLVGVREVSLLVRQYPSTQQYICALQSTYCSVCNCYVYIQCEEVQLVHSSLHNWLACRSQWTLDDLQLLVL